MRSVVAVAHVAAYPDPVRARAGEVVELGRLDPEHPGWRWCVGPDGREGWIHEVFCRPDGTVQRDYDARELTAPAGAAVEVIERVGGWLWCRAEDGTLGWLPEKAVTTAT